MRSWKDIAAEVFDLTNGNGAAVKPVTTEQYFQSAKGPIAPRPVHSALSLGKIEATGFTPSDWEQTLGEYVRAERTKQAE